MHELTDGVIIETNLRGVTVGAVFTNEGVILIDVPPFPDDAKRWRTTIQEYRNVPVQAVIVLDSHRDRMLGAWWFQPELLIAHIATHETLASLSNSYVSSIASALATNSREHASLSIGRIMVPTVTFTSQMRLHFGDKTLLLSHRPGPTRGSIWVHLPESNILFAGDSVVAETAPYVNSPYSEEWLAALDYLQQALADVRLIPGRGNEIDLAAIEPMTRYLELARHRVENLYEANRPPSEMVKIIHELLALFPPPLEYELMEVQQRVRTGLQFIYNEFREKQQREH
ncbi:MAG: MBL fold metallo-hydrolase [Anaerolineales bacterium]|nr:MBL fold metallo-hydrolase [Anaerolineales bacterium]